MNIKYNITSNIAVNATWVFNTGMPYSLRLLDSSLLNSIPLSTGARNQVLNSNRKNTQRLPYYHRLDLGFSYVHNLKYGEGTLRMGCYNVYNRKNVNDYSMEIWTAPNYFLSNASSSYSQTYTSKTGQSHFPFLPYISYQVTF